MFQFLDIIKQIYQLDAFEQGWLGVLTTSVRDHVSQRFGALSPQLKRAARFVLDNPDEVATHSLRHIAREAKLPPTTFSRLARAIGCESYDVLREMCRGEIRRRKSRFADKALELLTSEEGASARDREPFVVRHAAAAMSNVQTLLETVDFNRMERAAKTLARGQTVALIGTLSAAGFVDYSAYLAEMALPNWQVVRGDFPASALVGLGPKDAVLVMTFAPYAARTVRAAETVSRQGAHLVVVTDGAQSPVAGFAEDLLLVPTASPLFFPSHVAVLVLLEALMGMVVREAGKTAQQRIGAVERQNHVMGEYWQE